jgi:hypothetical protein
MSGALFICIVDMLHPASVMCMPSSTESDVGDGQCDRLGLHKDLSILQVPGAGSLWLGPRWDDVDPASQARHRQPGLNLDASKIDIDVYLEHSRQRRNLLFDIHSHIASFSAICGPRPIDFSTSGSQLSLPT